jgi:hypothetical protein
MNLKDFFLDELEREGALTRKAVERVPDNRTDWVPHPKSMPLGYLATLVAKMPGWVAMTVDHDEFDIKAPAAAEFTPSVAATSRELVEILDKSMAQARASLQKTTDEHLMKPWKFIVGGHVVSEDPRYVVLRDSVFNHLAHHRGQLTVYLRLNDAAVPSIYGPTADEPAF